MTNNTEGTVANGYKELEKVEMSAKELAINLYGLGLIAFFVFGFFFIALYALFTGKEHDVINISYTPGNVLIAISLFIATLIFHELIHGVFMSKYGGKPHYGADIAYFILPYLYATAKTIFLRNQFVVICIAPLVVISIAGVSLMAAFPAIAHWVLIPLIVNSSGAVGDLWMISTLLRYPEHVLVEDQKTGTIIYGKETDKLVNVSSTGFISKFLKGFIIAFFVMVILVSILPVALVLSGANSFTIGPKDSPFTIFDFSTKGFSLSIMPLLSLSGIAGLAYAIIKPSKQHSKIMGDTKVSK